MPIYEYRCKKCEERFDLMRRLADRDKAAKCPACGSRATTRNTILTFAAPRGTSPDAFAGDGESEDFGGGDLDMDDDWDF